MLQVLEELGADHLPLLTVWNKVDACAAPEKVMQLAARRPCTVAISAANGEGVEELLKAIEQQLSQQLTDVHCLVPYSQVRILQFSRTAETAPPLPSVGIIGRGQIVALEEQAKRRAGSGGGADQCRHTESLGTSEPRIKWRFIWEVALCAVFSCRCLGGIPKSASKSCDWCRETFWMSYIDKALSSGRGLFLGAL